jgi:hypothetical protein
MLIPPVECDYVMGVLIVPVDRKFRNGTVYNWRGVLTRRAICGPSLLKSRTFHVRKTLALGS